MPNTPTIQNSYQGSYGGSGSDVITFSPNQASGVLVHNTGAADTYVSFSTVGSAYGQVASAAVTPASGTDGSYIVPAGSAKKFQFTDHVIASLKLGGGSATTYSIEAF